MPLYPQPTPTALPSPTVRPRPALASVRPVLPNPAPNAPVFSDRIDTYQVPTRPYTDTTELEKRVMNPDAYVGESALDRANAVSAAAQGHLKSAVGTTNAPAPVPVAGVPTVGQLR